MIRPRLCCARRYFIGCAIIIFVLRYFYILSDNYIFSYEATTSGLFEELDINTRVNHHRTSNIKNSSEFTSLSTKVSPASSATTIYPWEDDALAAVTFVNHSLFFQPRERCALNFYGLPRSFRALVLPSIVRNILLPNAPYDCDIYVFTHYLLAEQPGRSGRGGTLDPNEIELLRDAAQRIGQRLHGPRHELIIRMSNYTDEQLWSARGDFLNQTRTTLDPHGRPLYFPQHSSQGYLFPQTLDNIVRMWHATTSVWQLMQTSAREHNVRYTRIAMLRTDVVYVTPIDIFRIAGSGQEANEPDEMDWKNKVAVIPGFAKYPVNDRMIYGPARAVQVWASERFALIDAHIQDKVTKRKGMGMHSEFFVGHTILPAIRQLNVTVHEDPNVCFLRARADETIWLNDCRRNQTQLGLLQKHLEETVQRRCVRKTLRVDDIKTKIMQLNCQAE